MKSRKQGEYDPDIDKYAQSIHQTLLLSIML